MEALILTCHTGGGHNAAGEAVKEELERQGHRARLLDPYSLAGKRLGEKIGNCYIALAQYAPRLFGLIYQLGALYRKLPFRSPVYWANTKMAKPMENYLREHPCDVILATHLFPCEILAGLRAKGISLPPTIYIATDYTCIPFTEEGACDFYVIPSQRLTEEFSSHGIPSSRLLPYGIPVRQAFCQNISRQEAQKALGLDLDRRYFLLSGGSIGAGNLLKAARQMQPYLKENPDCTLIVICGRHQRLYQAMKRYYQGNPQMRLLQSTSQMAEYMRASTVVLSKPGGLSSTEAAVIGAPLIHLSPIPGCETKNAAFFSRLGMSLYIGRRLRTLPAALEQLQNPDTAEEMARRQRQEINPLAAQELCRFVQSLTDQTT